MRVIAHRGGDARFPENTLEAVRDSFAAGADLVEVDVRFTRDEVPVVSHDPDLRRLFGVDRAVAETTVKEFRALRYRADPRYGPVALSDLLDAGAAPLLLHIKEGGPKLPRLLRFLRERGFRDRVVIGITSVRDLEIVREDGAGWRALAFIHGHERWEDYAAADIIRLWDTWLAEALCEAIYAAGREVWVMVGRLHGYLPVGIFAESRIPLYRRLGVEGVLINEVARFRRALSVPRFPRVVAHRGLALGCPENTIPAFLLARAAGAAEIELDVRGSRDRQLVVAHDPTMDRRASEAVAVEESDLSELRRLELHGEMRGVRVCTLEEVFRELGQSVDYNIHIKTPGENGWAVAKVIQGIRSFRLEHNAYIAGDVPVLEAAREIDSRIERCCLAGQTDGTVLDWAKRLECTRVQLHHGRADADEIARARAAGLVCNYFFTDDPAEGSKLVGAGVDAVLTNRADLLRGIVEPGDTPTSG